MRARRSLRINQYRAQYDAAHRLYALRGMPYLPQLRQPRPDHEHCTPAQRCRGIGAVAGL